MLLVINDKQAVCARCGTLRPKAGQDSWAVAGDHVDKGCKK
jgi:hypothetical protein